MLQFALRKFQRLTGLSGTERLSLSGVMKEGQFCDLGTFLEHVCWVKRQSAPTQQKTKYTLVQSHWWGLQKLKILYTSTSMHNHLMSNVWGV